MADENLSQGLDQNDSSALLSAPLSVPVTNTNFNETTEHLNNSESEPTNQSEDAKEKIYSLEQTTEENKRDNKNSLKNKHLYGVFIGKFLFTHSLLIN